MLWSVTQLRIHLVWRDVADTMSYRMDIWEKRATSAEGKTIRIAESSDMESWEALLDHVLSFAKMCEFWKSKRNKSGDVVTQLYQTEWYELWR